MDLRRFVLLALGGLAFACAPDDPASDTASPSNVSSDSDSTVSTDSDSTVSTESATELPLAGKHLFITHDWHTGDLGGPAGADALCNDDPNARRSGVYKALLGGGGRQACAEDWCDPFEGQMDWVLAPSTDYVITDDTFIFTTTAAGIVEDYPLVADLGEGVNFWSGLREPWTSHEENCDGWTSDSGELDGRVGWGASTSERWIQGGNFSCSRATPLLCVEQ